MSELMGIYAIWYRELKVYIRERSRVFASIVNPLVWLLILGGGLGSAFTIGDISYQTFIFPGVLAQAVTFSSIFYGVYIVWDRKVDFLKEVLVAPLSRTSIFVGKVFGGATDSLIQVALIFLAGFLLAQAGVIEGIAFTPLQFAACMAILSMSVVGLVSVGLVIGSLMESPEGFQLIGGFLVFPLFLLSGALFPIDNLPVWLAPLNMLDPLTYTVDALRGVLIGASHFGILADMAVIAMFSIGMIIAGTLAFRRMKV